MSDDAGILTPRPVSTPRHGISLVAVVAGMVLLLFSMAMAGMLRLGQDPYTLAKSAITADGSADHDGRLVCASGPASVEALVGDGAYIPPGRYVALRRKVEMYAWVEKTDSSTAGSGPSYVLEWTEHPPNSSQFDQRDIHENPTPSVPSATFYAPRSHVSGVSFVPAEVSLPSLRPLLNIDASVAARLERSARLHLADGYAYPKSLSIIAPKVGDIRLAWDALPAETTLTFFGWQHRGGIRPHLGVERGDVLTVHRGGRRDGLRSLRQGRPAWMTLAEQVHLTAAGVGAAIIVTTLLGGIPWRQGIRWVRWLVVFPTAILVAAGTAWWAFDSLSAAWLSPGVWIGLGLVLCAGVGRPRHQQRRARSHNEPSAPDHAALFIDLSP
jgi:hypothetical protein